jgi:TolB protein
VTEDACVGLRGAGAALACVLWATVVGGATGSPHPLAEETLAYDTDGGGIQLVDGAGGRRRELRGTRTAIDLAWSPDGSRLAFTAVTTEGGNPYADIWEIHADGSDLRRLTRNRSSSSPFWSPDGRFIYYGGGAGTWQMRPDGSNKHPIGMRHAPVGGWSPDTRREAWADEDREGHYQLYVSNADGSHLRRLTHNSLTYLGADVSFSQPAWSPDGKRLAFVETRGDHSTLQVIGVDGRGLRRIATAVPGVPDDAPDWSPRADVIAFEGKGSQVYVVKPDGTGLTRLTHDTSGDWSPRWRPHG